jgi:hypothetical protein
LLENASSTAWWSRHDAIRERIHDLLAGKRLLDGLVVETVTDTSARLMRASWGNASSTAWWSRLGAWVGERWELAGGNASLTAW